ncbi:transcription-repair coupling factor [Desulfacinum hydrothermale DSM 13146]|uniref:Transcription-repair-coupling factor n=1 Tax=Desulfacinum hydrothermale DSM 13146 TaxID=1121390 RepID=A0A1W1WX89_9BACT|nr:transcription-repair coupling factor [Desulfacinum hydrothermale]SMC16342.1 transcription-repair coupling factor [Desulfacinum hydrothermale DSM 13146]
MQINHPGNPVPASGFDAESSLSIPRLDQILHERRSPISLAGLPSQALALWVARLPDSHHRPVVVVTPTDKEAEALAEEIRYFRGDKIRPADPFSRRVRLFSSRSGHRAQVLGKMEGVARRLETLWALRHAGDPPIVVASALALLERLIPPQILERESEYRVLREEIQVDDLCARLVTRGYYPVPLVEEYGDFSRRGGVLDIYAPLYPWPLRLEFFGPELDAARIFHPGSQRSLAALEEVLLLPASEIILDDAAKARAREVLLGEISSGRLSPSVANVWMDKLEEGHQLAAFEPVLSAFYEELVSFFDYLPSDALVVWSDLGQVRKSLHETHSQTIWEWDSREDPDQWRRPAEELFLEPESVERASERFQNVWINAVTERDQAAIHLNVGVRDQEELKLAVQSHPKRERLLEPLARRLLQWQEEGLATVVVCDAKERALRLKDLLANYGLDVKGAVRGPQLALGMNPEGRELYLSVGPLRAGFIWPAQRLALVAESEVFGKRLWRRRDSKPLAGVFISSFQDLHVGDLVVHVDHGIGVYQGLVHLKAGGMESDFLNLEYQDGDRLYVPVDKLHKVQKYLGVEGQEPRVDRLGGKSWENVKRKARESAEKVARELLKIYALRQVREGTAFTPPDNYFREFEARFAFDETPDQIRAIEDVLQDMCSPRPMDRLICGDVGYGKTEVALRAAFKAVLDGKQVAMLVPTTVLAEQHYATFSERLKDFPVTVDVLSRFRSPAQQKQILERLSSGALDIVIGTHRLLQKDVRFKDLGLLIVDEEQRFGVRHKERLKELRVSVDVLTLTATPIPRTLHMALSGIRDLSTIETPPQDRKSVETSVCKFDEFTIREAIHRELRRGGQVFFVHNHVQSILQMAARIRSLVPEARVGVAHGQMRERELEKVMMDFVNRKVDVLVCTTIIESGLDIPAANTIIINRADKMGLAQIYQLRGRVGRSSEQAYAYLLIPGEHLVTRDAQKRLRALMDFSELGSGFKIALNDLQIRGGGAILGSAQSGHISAVGYELYLELLEETVRRLRGEEPQEAPLDPEIHIPVAAYLPTAYIPDADQRLVAYKRLSGAKTQDDIDDTAREWRDRYGPLPDEAKALLLLARMRLMMQQLGVARLDGGQELFSFTFLDPVNLDAVQNLLREMKCFVRLEGTRKLTIEMGGRGGLTTVAKLKRILQVLVEHGSDIRSDRQVSE